jgi:hypothetical protein
MRGNNAYGPPSVGVDAVLDVLGPVLSGGVAGDERLWAERALAAAYDPALGLDGSICKRDVLKLLASLAREDYDYTDALAFTARALAKSWEGRG